MRPPIRLTATTIPSAATRRPRASAPIPPALGVERAKRSSHIVRIDNGRHWVGYTPRGESPSRGSRASSPATDSWRRPKYRPGTTTSPGGRSASRHQQSGEHPALTPARVAGSDGRSRPCWDCTAPALPRAGESRNPYALGFPQERRERAPDAPEPEGRALACLGATLVVAASPAEARTHRLNHAWVFVMENHSLGHVPGRRRAPIRRLRCGYAPAHPSLPNYLAMISGIDARVSFERPLQGRVPRPTLASQLSGRGMGGRASSRACLDEATWVEPGSYVQHHNPFVQHLRSVTSKARQRRHLRNLRALRAACAITGAHLRRPEQRPQHARRLGSGRRPVALRLGLAVLHALSRLPAPRRDHHLGRGAVPTVLPHIHGGRIPLFIISVMPGSTTYRPRGGFGVPHLGLADEGAPRAW